jgi:hypothetical protein
MRVRKLGTWLAALAIALQAAAPLLVSAKPRSVALVPLCTVDGVTHYVEVPTGRTPPGHSSHGDHCAFCFVGDRIALPGHFEAFALADARAEVMVPAAPFFFSKSSANLHGARAPPLSLVVTSDDHNLGRQGETDLSMGRSGAGAPDSSRLVRLGLLHGRYAVEHAGRHHDAGHAA